MSIAFHLIGAAVILWATFSEPSWLKTTALVLVAAAFMLSGIADLLKLKGGKKE